MNLFVHDARDLWNGRAVRRLIVAAVVARLLAVAFHFLIAVVGFPDALALGFVVLVGDGNNRHVVVFVVCQDEPPMRRAAIRVPTRSVSHLKRGHAARRSARRASTFRTRNDKHHTHGFASQERAGSAKRPRRRLGEAGDGLVLCVVRFEDRVECGGVEQSPQMRTNVRELEGPTVGCRGLVTLDDLAQARAVHLLQVRDVQQNPTLAAMEKSNHPLCESAGVLRYL